MAKLRHILFNPTDVERLAQFYFDVLELEIIPRSNNGGHPPPT